MNVGVMMEEALYRSKLVVGVSQTATRMRCGATGHPQIWTQLDTKHFSL